MTGYSAEERNDDWEFKIVRSSWPVFHKREKLQALVDEEARAGWVMLEKLDDQRVRFKRPRSARAQDAYLPPGVDPHRTRYTAASTGTYVGLAFGILGLVLALTVVLGLIGVSGQPVGRTMPVILPAIFVLAGLGVFVVALMRGGSR